MQTITIENVIDHTRDTIREMQSKGETVTVRKVARRLRLNHVSFQREYPDAIALITEAESQNKPKIRVNPVAKCRGCGRQRAIYKTIQSQMWGKPVLNCYCESCAREDGGDAV